MNTKRFYESSMSHSTDIVVHIRKEFHGQIEDISNPRTNGLLCSTKLIQHYSIFFVDQFLAPILPVIFDRNSFDLPLFERNDP